MSTRSERYTALPAARLLPAFSPGLYGETSLGAVEELKKWGSARRSPVGGTGAVYSHYCCSQAVQAEALLHLQPAWPPLSPSHGLQELCNELPAPFTSCRPSPLCSMRGTRHGEEGALYSPAGFWGDGSCREQLPAAVAASCIPGKAFKVEAAKSCSIWAASITAVNAEGTAGEPQLHISQAHFFSKAHDHT